MTFFTVSKMSETMLSFRAKIGYMSLTIEAMYHLHYGGKKHGLYLIEQIKAMWAKGIIAADAAYLNEPTGAWEPVTELLKPSRCDAADKPNTSQPPLPPSTPPLSAKAGPWKRFFLWTAAGCFAVLTMFLAILIFAVLSGEPVPQSPVFPDRVAASRADTAQSVDAAAVATRTAPTPAPKPASTHQAGSKSSTAAKEQKTARSAAPPVASSVKPATQPDNARWIPDGTAWISVKARVTWPDRIYLDPGPPFEARKQADERGRSRYIFERAGVLRGVLDEKVRIVSAAPSRPIPGYWDRVAAEDAAAHRWDYQSPPAPVPVRTPTELKAQDEAIANINARSAAIARASSAAPSHFAGSTSPSYTYSTPSTASYTRPTSTLGYSHYYDFNYRPSVGDHYVRDYTRRDGTYVQGHYQTNADDSFWNNYSSYGNVNPYTGHTGYKLPPSGISTHFNGYTRRD